MRYFYLVCSFFFSYCAMGDDLKWSAIQTLIQESDIISHISEDLGPFEHFPADREQVEKDMRKEGLEENQIQANLAALNEFYQKLQEAKGPILSNMIDKIADIFDKYFTHEEIQELLRLFQNPVMKKFKQISLEKMPDLQLMLQKEKINHLKEPFEKMKKSLVNAHSKDNRSIQKGNRAIEVK